MLLHVWGCGWWSGCSCSCACMCRGLCRRCRACDCRVNKLFTVASAVVAVLFACSRPDYMYHSYPLKLQTFHARRCQGMVCRHPKVAHTGQVNDRWDLRHLDPIPLHATKRALRGRKPPLDLPAVVVGNFLYMVGVSSDHWVAVPVCAAKIAPPIPDTLLPTIAVRPH